MKTTNQRELDFNYTTLVLKKTSGAGSDEKRKWITYDNILEELHSLNEKTLVDEIKYRITDKEDDKKVFKEVVERMGNKSTRLKLLINSI